MSFGELDAPRFNEGDRVSASALQKLAAMAGRNNLSVDAFVDALGVYLATYPPIETWHFELAEELTQWKTTPTLVYRRFLDPSGNNGNGIFTTDCDESSRFYVMDLREVGYKGPSGSTGAADIIAVDNGAMGIVIDLRCPEDCICGTAFSGAMCGGGT